MRGVRAVGLGAAVLGTVLVAPGRPAEARLTRLEVASRAVVAGGAAFGAAGPYEKLRGTARFAVDPRDRRNAAVFDIGRAPRNAVGLVEFSADFTILKPVDMSRASGTLLFEVNNRGNKLAFILLNDAPADANHNDPSAGYDVGNGFLLRRGYVVAWVGWGADIAPGGDRLTVSFPVATEGGSPVSERILTEYSDRNFGAATPFTLPLSGGLAFRSYEAVSTDQAVAEAELRERRSDSPRPASPQIPPGTLVPRDRWSFARCPDGPPGTPSPTDICLAGGFRNDAVYELRYRATGSPVMGLGYVTSRDFVAFLRGEAPDDAGAPNPVAGLRTAVCLGISSSGMYYRDYLYQGFNEDERGRAVCDGVYIHIPGAHKLFLNYRFAQPNPFSVQHRERFVPDTGFPRHYAQRKDPLTGREDGILKRPATDPKVIHADTSTEYWQFRSSLVDTDEDGTVDLPQPPGVRRYLLSSTQHFPRKGAPLNRGLGDRQCEQPSNHTHSGINARALLVALDAWVRTGAPPPPSRVPRIADGTLVAPDRAATGFPEIPGVSYPGLYNASGERDFGPRVAGNAGVIDEPTPAGRSVHRVLVPKVDRFGNDAAGIRHPLVEVPVATLTGWNTRRTEFAGGDLCDLIGMTVPLARTRAARLAAGDPRPSLEELYGTRDAYLERLAAAARALAAARLMLEEDVERVIEEAGHSEVLR